MPVPRLLPLLLLALVACGGSKKTPPNDGASGTVGTSGGQVAATSGAAVAVPPGALDGDTLVKLAPIETAPPAGVGAVSPLYQFEPDGLIFASPVTVTLPIPAGTNSAAVYWERPDKSGYDTLGGLVDLVAHTITVDVPHFSHGVVGEARTTRLVTGTAMTTYISATGRISLPTPSFVPPQALVPDGLGGFTVYPGSVGTGPAAGTFLIPGVPVGEYLLRYGGMYLVTDSSSPNLSTRIGGRPPDQLLPVGAGTMLELTLGNLAPWQDGDQLEFFSTEANDWDFQSDLAWATPPLQAGDTAAVLAMDMTSLMVGPTALIQGSLGHHAYAAQIGSAISPGGVAYQAMTRLAALPSFDTVDGATTPVSATMVDYAQANTTALDIRFTAWKAAFARDRGPVAPPYDASDSGNLGVLAQPGQAEDGFYSSNADLLLIYDFVGDDLLTGAMHFGSPADSPFAGHWGVLCDVRWGGVTPFQLPGTTGMVLPTSSIEWTTSLAALEAGPITPPLTQPRLATVAGQPFFDGGTGIGLTPTLAWSPPDTGTAELYVVTLSELYANASGRTSSRQSPSFSSFATPHTSMTIPEGVLEAGRTYYFRLTAMGRAPRVHGLNDARANIVSGIFTP